MKITGVTCHVLLDPGFESDATSSAQDTIVVEVETDDGLVGIGETDLNAWIARECIEAPGMHTMDSGLAETLVGMDPLDPVAAWDRLYVGTAMTGRRGAAVHALGALDMALWDICGKAPERCRPRHRQRPLNLLARSDGAALLVDVSGCTSRGLGGAGRLRLTRRLRRGKGTVTIIAVDPGLVGGAATG